MSDNQVIPDAAVDILVSALKMATEQTQTDFALCHDGTTK